MDNRNKAKKYSYGGREFTLTELCKIFGQPRSSVAGRLKRGVPLERALVEDGRYDMNSKLLALSDKLKELRNAKSELDTQVKGLNEEIDRVTLEMIDIMTTDEVTSFNRNGTTFSLVTTEYPAPEPTRKGELWEAMREHGYADLFSINSQTLTATVKEMIANNDGTLPMWLEGLIKVGEKNSIRVAKTKKY